MQGAILRAIEANTAALRLLHEHLHHERTVLAAIEKLTAEVRGQNEKVLQSLTNKLDRAGDKLAKAVSENLPGTVVSGQPKT